MAEKTLANVPLSFVEYQALFLEPIFELVETRARIVGAVFKAFAEWNIRLDNVTWKQNPVNASEIQWIFTIGQAPGAGFSIGLGSASLLVTNPDWSNVDSFIRMARVGMEAVRKSVAPVINKQSATISMHLRPQGKAGREITTGFLNSRSLEDGAPAPRAYGFSLYWDDGFWVVDASGLYPDSLFVRMNRTFDPSVPLEDVARRLKTEEDRLLNVLGLRLE